MGVDSINNNSYIVCVYDSSNPYGRMVNAYKTKEEAKDHIKFQKEKMGSKAYWNILHIVEMEWISVSE